MNRLGQGGLMGLAAVCLLFIGGQFVGNVQYSPAVAAKESKKDATPCSNSKVIGLELPGDMDVNYDDQFVDVAAKCAGPVTFVVIATVDKLKYKNPRKGEKEITVGIPPTECVVTVFCVGYLKDTDEFTQWARCDIRVRGPPPPVPPPPDPPPPVPPPGPPPGVLKAAKFHVTIVEDPRTRTAATAALLANVKLRAQLAASGHTLRVRDVQNENTKRLGFSAAAERVGGTALILQLNDGKPGAHPPVGGTPVKLPATADALLAYIAKLQGD